jgi:hypothetical protein
MAPRCEARKSQLPVADRMGQETWKGRADNARATNKRQS